MFHRYTNYVFQGETIQLQNFDAMQHKIREWLKPNQVNIMNKNSAHKTNLLLAILVVSPLSLDSLRSNAFVIQLNHRPERKY